MLIAYHLFKQNLFKTAKIGLRERDACCLEVSGELWRCAIVRPYWNRLVVSSEDDRGWAIIVDIWIVGIADPQKVGGNGEWHFFALIDESYAFAAGDIYGAVEAVDHIEWSHWRVDENLWILAANNA